MIFKYVANHMTTDEKNAPPVLLTLMQRDLFYLLTVFIKPNIGTTLMKYC